MKRLGKFKNWQVGQILKLDKIREDKWEIDVLVYEISYNGNDEEYVAKNMLTVVAKKENFVKIINNLEPGELVLIGYYTQSYRSSNAKAYTINTLRALERINKQQLDVMAISIWANKKDPAIFYDTQDSLNRYFLEEED